MKRLIALFTMLCTIGASAARIKDIASIEGNSGVQVVGYGLVTGLNNSGDTQRSNFTMQSVMNLLKRFGITPQQALNMRTRNVAAVMVTATIPAFLKKGAKIDVQVSSAGDAESLQGGVLLMSPLQAADGTLYGFAQGAISVGGFDFRSLGSRSGRNFTTSGRVPQALILEKAVEGSYSSNSQIRILLHDPDFTTAIRVAESVNALPNLTNSAQAVDAGTIAVTVPAGSTPTQILGFISQIESATVVSDVAARVVINERTGTVVVGGNVQLLPAVVAHGGLEIQIQRNVGVSQPAPFSTGTTQRLENATVNAQEERNPPVEIQATTSVKEMAAALTKLKVSPRDLIAIFQALKESGSLQGELIIQ
ncbi:MAG: flagellar basal body P-ring protein FlgI [Candidatus Kapabacteria bacterium]|nr:flagellar basal body P-ring protein FlgI [Candidatus Kapabacteria bacterium]